MHLILATGPRANIEAASKLLEAIGGFGAIGWWELERRQFRLEAYAYSEDSAQTGVGAIALSGIELDARIAPLEEADWVKMSLEGLPPVPAGRFRVVGSHDKGRTKDGRIEVVIDAGEAFGTGHHGTTSRCLLALDRLARQGRRPKRVLDVGCGSAILSIAAAKMGARCTGTEIDPRAAWIAGYNAKLNQVKPRFRAYVANGVRRASIRAQGPYDLVFANILKRPLIRLAPDLAASVAPGGRLVLSGLLSHQEPSIRMAYAQRGMILEHRFRKENWSTLTWVRPVRA